MFFLDTNTCIDFLRGRKKSVRTRLLSHRPAEIAIPSLVKAELLVGALKSERRQENLVLVRQFLQPFAVAEFGDRDAEHYAEIRAALEQDGNPIGPNDLIIAAMARAQEVVLVTHNITEFGRVSGVRLEDWTTDS